MALTGRREPERMRIAVLADIHGNHRALEAVLLDLRRQAPDLVVNLGDCLSGPLDARATADLLIGLGWPTVRGNHDRQLLDTPIDAMGASDRAAAAAIDGRHRDWLAALPPTLRVESELLLVHGTPDSDTVYLCEDVGPAGPHAAAPADIERRAGDVMATVILCGHSHVPRLVRTPRGRLVLNPGSVGLQAYSDETPRPHVMAVGSPHARYAVMDRTTEGWDIGFRTVEYDWDAAAAEARRAGRPDWAEALATGWLTP
jgi:predicted phosphodiesterase